MFPDTLTWDCCCSVAELCLALWPLGLQLARLPCPSVSPGVGVDACPLGRWCRPAASRSALPFCLWAQSFPASASFPVSQLFASGGQSIGASSRLTLTLLSFSHSSDYSWLISLKMDWFDLLAFQGTLKRLLQHHNSKAPILQHSAFFMVHLSHLCNGCWKNRNFDCMDSLLSNMLSRVVIVFLPKNRVSSVPCLQSPSAGILELRKIPCLSRCALCPVCHNVMGLDAVILVFWMLSFKPAFSLLFFTIIKTLFSFSLLFIIIMVSSAYLRLLIYLSAVWTPACDSSSPACHVMYSAYKLNKQGDNIQPLHNSFPNLEPVRCSMSGSVTTWPAYMFLRRQVRWSSIPVSKNFHSLLWFTQSKALV